MIQFGIQFFKIGRTYGTQSNSALFPGLKSKVTKWIEPTGLSYNDIKYKL